jgi:hypothetical protein
MTDNQTTRPAWEGREWDTSAFVFVHDPKMLKMLTAVATLEEMGFRFEITEKGVKWTR